MSTGQTVVSGISWDDIEKCLQKDSGFLEELPQFSWQILREYMEQTVKTPRNGKRGFSRDPKPGCKILYDNIIDDTSRNRAYSNDNRRKSAAVRDRRIFTDKEFLKEPHAWENKRTTLYITDISGLCVATLLTRENEDFLSVLRSFLQCHLAGGIHFAALKPKIHNTNPSNVFPRHIAVDRKFTYEFHLPYVVLRDSRFTERDRRRFRRSVQLIEPSDMAKDSYAAGWRDLECFDAHVSLLVVGRDESNWKAYCTTDTYYGGQPGIQYFVDNDLDAPAGDARSATHDVCMNPREFFVLVLSHRMRQVSHEWGNTSTALLQRLNIYESHYLRRIDKDLKLHDDQRMTRTRSYSKAASVLRQFYDIISNTVDCLEIFLKENGKDFFGNQDDFVDNCACYETRINDAITKLKSLRTSFHQRMQRFESMRDGLLSASVLRENRQATQQSQDIEALTEISVLFLPFSLAAAIFGMSKEFVTIPIWLSWMLTSTLLAMLVALLIYSPSVRTRILLILRRIAFIDKLMGIKNNAVDEDGDYRD